MSDYEIKKLEMDFKAFTSRNFTKPNDCRNADQIRFYVGELSRKIEEYEATFKYVPSLAYALLVQYNIAHNRMVEAHFKSYT